MRTSEIHETNANPPIIDTPPLRFSCTSDFSVYIPRFQPHYESKTNRRSSGYNITPRRTRAIHTTLEAINRGSFRIQWYFISYPNVQQIASDSARPFRYRLRMRAFPNIFPEKLPKFFKPFLYVHLQFCKRPTHCLRLRRDPHHVTRNGYFSTKRPKKRPHTTLKAITNDRRTCFSRGHDTHAVRFGS